MDPVRTPRFAYKGDRLKPLRAFCQVARLGSVSRAAEALYVSQPAVSQQLQALEREMGAKLLERSGRRLIPTPEGEARTNWRARVDGSTPCRPPSAASWRHGRRELEIAANSSTILYLLPRIVGAIATAPQVRLRLHNAISADGTDLLRADTVELVVGSMLDVPADLSYVPVYSFTPMLITPRDHPLATTPRLTLEDISKHGLILPPQRQVTWRLVDLVFQQARVPYTVSLEVGGWEVIKQYVAMGLGISIVSSICLDDGDRERLAIRPLDAWFPARTYGVVVRKGKVLSPQARAFIDLIRPDLFVRRGREDSGHSER